MSKAKYKIKETFITGSCNENFVKCICKELAETFGEILPTEIRFGVYLFKIDNCKINSLVYEIFYNHERIGKLILEKL